MKQLFILFLINFFLLNSATAEEITLDCKFISGFEKDGQYQTERKLIDDINEVVILDVKKNKVLKGSFHFNNETGYWKDELSEGKDSWDENYVSWQHSEKDSAGGEITLFYRAKINRISGQMQTMMLFKIPNTKSHILTEKNYECSKSKKLF
jgi:hypothetical protein